MYEKGSEAERQGACSFAKHEDVSKLRRWNRAAPSQPVSPSGHNRGVFSAYEASKYYLWTHAAEAPTLLKANHWLAVPCPPPSLPPLLSFSPRVKLV